jgi:hypothetical protein
MNIGDRRSARDDLGKMNPGSGDEVGDVVDVFIGHLPAHALAERCGMDAIAETQRVASNVEQGQIDREVLQIMRIAGAMVPIMNRGYTQYP